jgi:hypothetical protein
MKKALVLGAMLLLVASSALATPGIDLSANSCARSSTGSPPPAPNVDLAAACLDYVNTFTDVDIIATFQPNGAVPQIAAFNGIMDMQIGVDYGDPGSAFWNWFNPNLAECNRAGLGFLTGPKPAGARCGIYLDTWRTLAASNGGAAGAGQFGARIQRVAFNATRDNNAQNVNNDQACFAATFTLLLTTATESGVGGVCDGCGTSACLVFNDGYPESFDGAVVSPHLTTPTGQGANGTTNVVTFNGGLSLCAAVPAKKKTWGQLKSLYR